MACELLTTEYGQCRCCSIKGNHLDINKEYCWEGIREVYSDIFMECFNLCLSRNPNMTTLICSECITRLRDANSFKILVVNSEKQMLETIEHGDLTKLLISHDLYDNPYGGIKLENKPFKEKAVLGYEASESSDCVGSEDDMIILEERIPPTTNYTHIDREKSLVSRFSKRQLRPLPTHSSLKHICRSFANHLKLLEGKVITGKTLENLLDRDVHKPKKTKRVINKSHLKIDSRANKRVQKTKYIKKLLDADNGKNPYQERLSHATNIAAILEYSNVTAFKSKHQRAYRCFYCAKHFEDFEELRKHQSADHTKVNMRQCILSMYKRGKSESLVVYVDVTGLKCTICDKTMSNIKELKTHLTETHDKKMFLDLSDRVIPFKVCENNFECLTCGNLYETFGSIERHMNNHYRNYVCEECDSGFVTKQRLKTHGYLIHSNRPEKYACDICKKKFDSRLKRKLHIDTVHENLKKYKCNRCPERFNNYFRRHKHMVSAHGVAPIEYKCNVCEKTFDRRYSLSTHMRTHIQQKDVYCELCPYRCFTKVELRHHMIKHNGERIHECPVCKKSYARQKTLKEHMRIHTNDRRYVCNVCGMAFIQNCSLKSHINSHHKEYGL